MNWILFLIILIILFIMLLLVTVIKVTFLLNTDQEIIALTLFWLYPFLKIKITNEGNPFILTGYLFTIPIIKKQIKANQKKAKQMQLIKKISMENLHIHSSYFFSDPFMTGLACGILGVLSSYFHLHFENKPNFFSSRDFVYISSSADINIGSTIHNLIKPHSNVSFIKP